MAKPDGNTLVVAFDISKLDEEEYNRLFKAVADIKPGDVGVARQFEFLSKTVFQLRLKDLDDRALTLAQLRRLRRWTDESDYCGICDQHPSDDHAVDLSAPELP